MFDVNRWPNQLLFATVRVVLSDPESADPEHEGGGTAFFFNFRDRENLDFPSLVTNRHVVYGQSWAIAFHEGGTGPHLQPSWTVLPEVRSEEDYVPRWLYCPGEDLAVLPLGPIITHFEQLRRSLCYTSFDMNMVLSTRELQAMSATQEILMPSYPDGIVAESEFPTMSRGSTATHPSLDYPTPGRGLIDASAFQGSSGAPILCSKGPVSVTEEMNLAGTSLLGIFVKTRNGATNLHYRPPKSAELPIRDLLCPVPLHLGVYIKAEALTEVQDELWAGALEAIPSYLEVKRTRDIARNISLGNRFGPEVMDDGGTERTE